MTYIYLNYGEMKIVIGMLNNYAEDAAKAGEVRRVNDDNNGAGDVSSMANWDGLVAQLSDKAKEIDARVELAKAQSESGITSKSGDLIAYHLPDNVDDTIDNIQSSAQGMKDAEALKQAGEDMKKGGDPKTYNETLKNIKDGTIDPTYAASFVKIYGVEKTIEMSTFLGGYDRETPFENSPIDETGVAISREILSKASQTWNSDESKNAANQIRSFIGDPGSRTARFNAVMGGDQKYGKEFLVDLAKNFEGASWNKALDDPENRTGIDAYGFSEYSLDPMVGALNGMAHNDEAALAYLESNGGTAADAKHVKELMVRHDLGDNKWTDIWAGIAERTSSLYASEHVDADHPASDNAKRTAALSSTVVNGIGEATTKVSDTARASLTKVVSAYPWSLDQTARTGGTPKNPVIDPGGNTGWTQGMSYQPQFSSKGLSGVMQAISRDENSFKTVAESVASMERRRMTYEAWIVDTNTKGQGYGKMTTVDAGVRTAIEANSATSAFLLGASRAAVEGDATATDKRNKMIVDTLFGLSSFIPGPGEGVSQIWKDTLAFSQDTTKRIAQNSATETFTQNLTNALNESETMKDDDRKAATTVNLTQLIGLGIIPAVQANNAVPGLVRDDGTMDPSKITSENIDKLHNYFIVNPPDLPSSTDDSENAPDPEDHRNINPDLHDAINGVNNTEGDIYGAAYNRGQGK